MDDEDREALRAEGLEPDDPAVVMALNVVRWELSLLAGTKTPPDLPGVNRLD
jgi:hypothetical protein